MRNVLKTACAAALLIPLLATAAEAAVWGRLSGAAGAQAGGDAPVGSGSVGLGAQAGGLGPPAASPPRGGFRGGGFRGGYYRGFYPRSAFYGSVFFGPGFGFYDPFWPYYDPFWRYGYYYPPTRVIVREIVHPPDYLPPPEGPPPQANWYYCSDPQGYYPYVRDCNVPWQPVPAQPEVAPPS